MRLFVVIIPDAQECCLMTTILDQWLLHPVFWQFDAETGEVKTAFMANKNTKLAGQPPQPWRVAVEESRELHRRRGRGRGCGCVMSLSSSFCSWTWRGSLGENQQGLISLVMSSIYRTWYLDEEDHGWFPTHGLWSLVRGKASTVLRYFSLVIKHTGDGRFIGDHSMD